MFSLISCNNRAKSIFEKNASRIAYANGVVVLISLIFCYAIDSGNISTLSSAAGYIVMASSALFVFDACRYFLLDREWPKRQARKILKRENSFLKNEAQTESSSEIASSRKLPESLPLIDSPVETVRKELLEWLNYRRLGQAGYQEEMDKVGLISAYLPKIPFTLHHVRVNSSFHFYWGEKAGSEPIQERMIPISLEEGTILDYELKKERQVVWPLQDVSGPSYFVPLLSEPIETLFDIDIIKFLENIIKKVEEEPSDLYARRMLEILIPYDQQIRWCGNDLYKRVRKLIPRYPPIPIVQPLKRQKSPS